MTVALVHGCCYLCTVAPDQAVLKYTLFFISNTFISNTRLKLAKLQAKLKQNSEAELLLFENYSLSLSALPSKNNRKYPKKCTKNKCVC